MVPKPSKIELHLNTDTNLPKKHGRKIKSVGGEYGSARGYTDTRFVTVPYEHRDLINELIALYGKKHGKGETICICRSSISRNWPAWVVVHKVKTLSGDPMTELDSLYEKSYNSAVDRKIIKEN